MFGKKKSDAPEAQTPTLTLPSCEVLFLCGAESDLPSALEQQIQRAFESLGRVEFSTIDDVDLREGCCRVVVSYELSPLALQKVLMQLKDFSAPIRHIIAMRAEHLTSLGEALSQAAVDGTLRGVRLVVLDPQNEVAPQVFERVSGEVCDNIIAMPMSPEVENTPIRYFYCISPELLRVAHTIRELAENNITRVYLLGAPGAGKTSFAYYYWLSRKKGRFVALNLVAENTGDKTAVKSLICGHVAGAIPGTTSREGALAYAGDGVCFLDESHGMSGAVMEVLMEVLDNNQYLPLGATKKRFLDCAVIFASNRSWDTLLHSLPLDEHARLGATVIEIPNLAQRQEDIIAVAAATLARLRKQFTSWKAPEGLTGDAWALLLNCPWRGNVRTLVRVIEASAVKYGRRQDETNLIQASDIADSLKLWEPEQHASHAIYASYSGDSN